MKKCDDLLFIDADKIVSVSELNALILTATERFVCISRLEVCEKVNPELIFEQLKDADIIHCGLQFEGATAFRDLQSLTFNWNFLTPISDYTAYSWKATKDFICFNSQLAKRMNGFVEGLSVNASIMEFCYRVMNAGGLVKHLSELFAKPKFESINSITRADTLFFAKYHLGKMPYLFLRFFYLVTVFKFPRLSPKQGHPDIDHTIAYDFKILKDKKIRRVDDYTAIIPTIDRYDYIGKSIISLLNDKFPPKEIIVVDQTSISSRRPEVYDPFIKSGCLRVFYLDKPGQCSARNLAIKESTCHWLLFWEDDTEAWPDMIEEHISLMEYTNVDVSTGVSLAPWKDKSYIPKRLKKLHVADVLATGNSLMARDTALSVNGLHLAFDRGSGADDDFGRRLFLTGKLIVFNHKAIQTHHKAPTGGMRVHGAWWRNTSKLFQAYPPPTQMFMIRKYYPGKFWFFQILLFYIQLIRGQNFFKILLIFFLSPYKVIKSFMASKKLMNLE